MNPHEISHFCWSNPQLSSQHDGLQVPVEDGPTDEELAKAAAMKKDGPTVRLSRKNRWFFGRKCGGVRK